MPPTWMSASNGDVLLAQALLRLRDRDERLLDLARRRQHRHQDAHVAVVRRAQDRAQLRDGTAAARRGRTAPRASRAPDSAPRARARRALLLLVGAQVERADRDRLALHALGHGAVRLELLVLRGQPFAVEEQELGAEQADAGRAVVDRLREVLGQLDVREEVDVQPSSVSAGLVRRRLSFCRASSSSLCFSRYSASTARSGLMMTTPSAPSTISISLSRISARALCVATTAGTLRLRATIAVCDVTPPTSVRNAP